MRQKIKDFLNRKRFFKKGLRVLKNKKGFSLLEVLIGVAIIGIISGIAIPRFADYRETATLTAVDTTANNLGKAFNLCIATDTAGTGCDSIADLKIDCPICKGEITQSSGANKTSCVALEKKSGNKTYKACVQIDGDGKVTKTYGGDFKVCLGKLKTEVSDPNITAVFKKLNGSLKRCKTNDDCTASAAWQDAKCGEEHNGGCASGVCS